MKDAAEILEGISEVITSLASLAWPFLLLGVIFLFRREVGQLFYSGLDVGFELFGSKIRIRPTKPPQDKSSLPPIPKQDQLPSDYVYLNHTSFIRENMQEEFHKRTGVQLPHYDIRVIVDSYYSGAIDAIERVEYVLHEAYPNPIQVRTNRANKFLLKEVANGEYVLLAKVSFRNRKQPTVLQRYITLWKDGPRLE